MWCGSRSKTLPAHAACSGEPEAAGQQQAYVCMFMYVWTRYQAVLRFTQIICSRCPPAGQAQPNITLQVRAQWAWGMSRASAVADAGVALDSVPLQRSMAAS